MFSVLSTFFSENFEPEWALRLENRDKSQGYRIVFGFQDIFSGAEKTALEKQIVTFPGVLRPPRPRAPWALWSPRHRVPWCRAAAVALTGAGLRRLRRRGRRRGAGEIAEYLRVLADTGRVRERTVLKALVYLLHDVAPDGYGRVGTAQANRYVVAGPDNAHIVGSHAGRTSGR